jgi:hypothetical protein
MIGIERIILLVTFVDILLLLPSAESRRHRSGKSNCRVVALTAQSSLTKAFRMQTAQGTHEP